MNKKDTDRALEERKKDIDFNAGEIKKQRKEVCIEVDNLKTYMERMKDCLEALDKNARVICQKCVILREGRIGIDLVSDFAIIYLQSIQIDIFLSAMMTSNEN